MYSNINKIDFTRARRTSLSFTSQRCPTLRSLLHFDELGLELGYAGCLLRPLVVVRPVAFAEVDVLEGGARIALLVRLPSPGSPAGGGEIEKLVRACKISGFPIHQVWNKKLNHHICRLRDEIHTLSVGQLSSNLKWHLAWLHGKIQLPLGTIPSPELIG